MLDEFDSGEIAAKVATAVVLDAWRRLANDPDLTMDQRLDSLAADLATLTDTATALRAIAEAVAGNSSEDAARARAAQKAAASAAAAARFKAGGRAVEKRIDARNAQDRLDRDRKILAESEAAFAKLERDPTCPSGERLIAEGALHLARQRVKSAEDALAACQGTR